MRLRTAAALNAASSGEDAGTNTASVSSPSRTSVGDGAVLRETAAASLPSQSADKIAEARGLLGYSWREAAEFDLLSASPWGGTRKEVAPCFAS